MRPPSTISSEPGKDFHGVFAEPIKRLTKSSLHPKAKKGRGKLPGVIRAVKSGLVMATSMAFKCRSGLAASSRGRALESGIELRESRVAM